MSNSVERTNEVVELGATYAEAKRKERVLNRINKAIGYPAGILTLTGAGVAMYNLIANQDTTSNVGAKMMVVGLGATLVRGFYPAPQVVEARKEADAAVSNANALSNVDYYGEDAAQPVEWLVDANAEFEEDFARTMAAIRNES